MASLSRGLHLKTLPGLRLLCTHQQPIPPSQARVVVCGGGLVGTSIAHYIAEKWPEKCIVIDSFLTSHESVSSINQINSSCFSHFKTNPWEAHLVQLTCDLLNVERCGSLYLAFQDERVQQFKRVLTILKNLPVNDHGYLLSPSEVKRQFSQLNVDDGGRLKAGMWLPFDGIIGDLKKAKSQLRKLPEKNGVIFYYGWQVKRILTMANKVIGVEVINLTDGRIAVVGCEYFINAGGFWSRSIGQLSNPVVRVPVMSCQHQVLETLPDDSQINSPLPPIHDCDNSVVIYSQPDSSLLIHGFPVVSRPIEIQKSVKPRIGFDRPSLNHDWNAFHPSLNAAIDLVPQLSNLNMNKLHCYPRDYSADGRPIIGESAEIANYYIAAAVNHEICGGVGRLLASRITGRDDRSFKLKGDYWAFDPRRFVPKQDKKFFLVDRLREVPRRLYYGNTTGIPYYDDFKTGHRLRVSPIYPRLQEAGAVFVQIMGYERPALYLDKESNDEDDPNLSTELDLISTPKHRILESKTWGKPAWFDVVHKEYDACREGVAICDYCSFSKLELSSPGNQVVNFLQYLCSNDVDIDVGGIVHTGMHNELGGYENDVSLVRLEPNRFMVIGPTEQQTRCLTWINRNKKDNRIEVKDVTDHYTALCLMGPVSRQLMSSLVTDAHEFDNFPFFTHKELEIGHSTNIRVCNLTHTGELGWVLYIPNEHALQVYDTITNVGHKYGLRHAGSIAMRILRIEKFYAFWGQDLDTTTTPLECGRGFRVKFDKDFIGKAALLEQKGQGVKRRYVQLILEDKLDQGGDQQWPWGFEPIYAEGFAKPVGMTTTTGFGFTLGRHVCLGFIGHTDPGKTVTNDYVLKTRFKIEIAGKHYWAKANIHSPKLTDVHGTYMATR